MSSDLSPKLRKRVYTRDNWRCFYCGKDTSPYTAVDYENNPTIDHLQPEHRGGAHIETNLVTACHGCNKMKRHMTVEEYRRFVSRSTNGLGACQDHLTAALSCCPTPFDKQIENAIEWIDTQLPAVRFWGEGERSR